MTIRFSDLDGNFEVRKLKIELVHFLLIGTFGHQNKLSTTLLELS